MTSELETVFGELGLSQYLDAFVEQGFDAWDIILDIQESDLDALGVKLGHRRKLQRRIANARGISPSASLASPVRANLDDVKADGSRCDTARTDSGQEGQGVAKRKYRRHPKPDENAPERPPSAYVLFSNKMREDLRSQNLSFTEIAKLVGENWQSLAPAEKETYERQANADKEKYHRDLMEYKKTPEYRKYMQYLQEFKEKQAKQIQVNDSSKRPRLEPARLRQGSTSSNTPPGTHTSSGSEPPPSRQERIDSIASGAESQHSSTTPTLASQANSIDDSMSSPRGMHIEGSPRESHRRHARRPSSWREGGREGSGHHHLPSLSDMLDDGRMGVSGPASSEGNPYSSGFVAANLPRSIPEPPNVLPTAPPSRAPLLRNEPSSTGSLGSISPATSFARTPGEGPLPIHALLSNHTPPVPPSVPMVAAAFDQGSPPSLTSGASPSPTEPPRPPFTHLAGPRGYGFHPAPSTSQLMQAERSGDGDALMMPAPDPVTNGFGIPGRFRLDGVSALLRAGEIVGKPGREE